jgi:hypothetical protein
VGIVPLSNFVPRGFGFVHHSIAILYHEVPNLSITIRNFFIAVCVSGCPEELDDVCERVSVSPTRPQTWNCQADERCSDGVEDQGAADV